MIATRVHPSGVHTLEKVSGDVTLSLERDGAAVVLRLLWRGYMLHEIALAPDDVLAIGAWLFGQWHAVAALKAAAAAELRG